MNKTKIFRLFFPLIGALLSLQLVSCSDSDPAQSGLREKGSAVEFGMRVRELSQVRSRDLDSVYITSKYDTNFYIELDCAVIDSTANYVQYGTYTVPSGYEGRLSALNDSPALMWHDLQSPHTFYGWTLPWIDESDNYVPSANPVTVTFYNSSEESGYAQYQNNQILEQFLGAMSGPFEYVNHGKYVDLTFFHLVSKITIGEFVLIKSNGAIEKNLKANITFLNMPTTATFYPHPSGGGVPYVEPGPANEDTGITYFIDNSALETDQFYICPEVDFSNLSMMVEINNAEYAGYDTYFGNFSEVEFERIPGTDYDSETVDDTKILHAGEMMTLNIILYPGQGPGMKIIIGDWSTEDPEESQYHTYPGVYSDTELGAILAVFTGQTTYDPLSAEEQDLIEHLFEIYGTTGPDGTMYFPLYDNVSTTSNIFPIPKGYVLDGTGHTITMKTNRGVFPGNPPYFNIGPAKNVYLTDSDGNTIYIDEESNIWIFDTQSNSYVPTEYSLPPLENGQKSYDINCVTGEVRPSTYYNNQITQ